MATTEQTTEALNWEPLVSTSPTSNVPLPAGTEEASEPLDWQPIKTDFLQGAEEQEQEYEFPLMASIQSAAADRRKEVQDAWSDYLEGNQDLSDTFTQTIGKGVVGTATDVAGLGAMEGITSAYALLPKSAREGVSEYAEQAWNWLQNDPTALAAYEIASQVPEMYNEWKRDNPQDARTMESIVNIGSILAPRRPKAPLDKDNLPLHLRGQQALEARVAANKQELAVDLLTPSKITEEAVSEGRVTSSALGTRTTKLSEFEERIADSVSKLNIKPSNSILKNANIIRESIGEEAKKLSAFLKDITIDTDFLNSRLSNAVNDAKNNLLITSDKGLKNVVDQMKTKLDSLLSETDGSAASLLKARKDFDSWVSGQTGKGAFGEKVNAISVATKTLRNSINDVIQDQANRQVPLNKLGFVEDSLEKQYMYYEALERIAPKVAEQSKYAAGRLLQTIKQNTGINIPTSLLSAGVTAGYITGLEMAALLPIGIGAVGLAGLAGVRSDTMTRFLLDTLTTANKAIKVTKDPVLENILKKDRAVVIGLLQNTEKVKEEASK